MAKYVLVFGSIKNVGVAAVDSIVEERTKHGPFEDFPSFCERIQGEAVNKKCIESLIKAGVFDEMQETRATLMASFETILDSIQSSNKKGLEGQVSMFDLGGEQEKKKLSEMKYTLIKQEEYSKKELLFMEKEMLGLYISGHPLENLRQEIEKQTTINSLQIHQITEQMENIEEGKLPEYRDGQNVTYAGIITSIKKKYTKNNKIMAFVTVEDLYGQVEIIVFENAYLAAGDSLINDNTVLVKGRLSIREDEETKIVANQITSFSAKKQTIVSIDITDLPESEKEKLRGAIHYFNGERNNMQVQVIEKGQIKPCGTIFATPEIIEQFKELVGENRVMVEEK